MITEADVFPEAPPTAELEQLYTTMARITAAETATVGEVRSGKLNAAVYPVRGLEAVCGALSLCMLPTDYLVSTYRNLGDALAKGVILREIVAEAYGRMGGTSKGKGGPMHLADVSNGLMVTSGIVGGGVPIAAGLALAAKLDGSDAATVVTFGDGATSIGATHEAMNLAALWKLPLVFLCQNNQWGEHTALAEYAGNPALAERAASYGMRAERVDGFDPMATLRALRSAVADVRGGLGPVFVEAVTYRLGPHSAASDWSYMPKEDYEAALRRDPTPSFRAWLVERGHIPEDRLAEIDSQIKAEVDDAMEFGRQSPWPGPDELLTDVFASPADLPSRTTTWRNR